MKQNQQCRRLLAASLTGYVLCSASVLLLPFSESEGARMNSAAYALAVLFWTGLAAGSIIFLLAWRKVKDSEDYREAKAKLRPGIISFFHGKAGVVTDILLTAALAVTIAGNYSRKIPYPVSVGGMFVFLLTLFLHLVVGGRVWTFAHGQKAAGNRKTGNESL